MLAVGFIANLLIRPVNERFHEPTSRQRRFDRAEPVARRDVHDGEELAMDTFVPRAILLWMLVVAALGYGVINTISQVVDLFSG